MLLNSFVCFTQPQELKPYLWVLQQQVRNQHCLNFSLLKFSLKVSFAIKSLQDYFCTFEPNNLLLSLSFLFLLFLFLLSYSLLLFRFLSHVIILNIDDPRIATSTSIITIATHINHSSGLDYFQLRMFVIISRLQQAVNVRKCTKQKAQPWAPVISPKLKLVLVVPMEFRIATVEFQQCYACVEIRGIRNTLTGRFFWRMKLR